MRAMNTILISILLLAPVTHSEASSWAYEPNGGLKRTHQKQFNYRGKTKTTARTKNYATGQVTNRFRMPNRTSQNPNRVFKVNSSSKRYNQIQSKSHSHRTRRFNYKQTIERGHTAR